MNDRENREHTELIECSEELIDAVLTAATTVHRTLGPGLLEAEYERALMIELAEAGIPARRQVEIAVKYRGDVGLGFGADIIVADCLLLELKSVDDFTPIDLAQIITYLKLLGFKRGFLINFKKKLLKEGIKRVSI
ncbi:MAG TPA: GxxExxY protein [Blastocatellia bacterium]|nr:GxxExxY protein [Blastocatellia bacterium]